MARDAASSNRASSRQTVAVNYPGRGAVLWRSGRLRFAGPRCERRIELEAAVEALLEMENVDRSSAAQVRDALLTIGGARLVRDPQAEA